MYLFAFSLALRSKSEVVFQVTITIQAEVNFCYIGYRSNVLCNSTPYDQLRLCEPV